MALVDQLRRARESWVSIGAHDYLVRRPTPYQLALISDKPKGELLRQFVVGWRKVTELDIAPGHDAKPAEFDPDLLVEWIGDRPDDMVALIQAVMDSVARAHAAREDAEKK
jgi:hypothetical protein